jgi:hypothetical protein
MSAIIPPLYAGLLAELRALPPGADSQARALALASAALRELGIVCERSRWPGLADGAREIAGQCHRLARPVTEPAQEPTP